MVVSLRVRHSPVARYSPSPEYEFRSSETQTMSTKRKRPIEEVENSQPGTPSAKKRKGRITNAEKEKIHAEMKKARGVLQVLKTPKGGNKDVTEHFIRTPSRRTDPQYYKTVKSPIDLTRIQQKINASEYRTFEEFCEDVELLVENSKNYYNEATEEHKDAQELYNIYKEAKERVEQGLPFSDEEEEDEDEDGASTAASSTGPAHSISSGRVSRASNMSEDRVEPLWVDDILCGILELTDKSGRLLSPPFRVLQPKEEFPIYYEKIKNPIDLKRIAQKGRAGEYKFMGELEADIRLLCKNAQQFSGKTSDIYKDASAIVEYFKEKSEQVMEKGVHNRRRVDVVLQLRDNFRREKAINQVNALLAQEASNADVDYSEDSEEDEDMKDSTDPLWKLYWTLRNEPNPKEKGALLSDPFVELPSKSCYPDYYDDIKQPMSFFMIHKTLKRKGYASLVDMLKDCMQIFANACEYNIETSAYYIAAKKLEELALKKAAELQPGIDITVFDKKPTVQVASPSPKVKAPKPKVIKIKQEVPDSSSDEKDSLSTPPPSKKKWTPRKQRPISTGMTAEHLAAPGRPGRKSMDELMLRFRQKLVVFWDLLYNYREGDYWPIGAFMDLPKVKEYPDYYDVINHPIDMKEIRKKIENNKYDSSTQLMADLELMFANARTFNDPGSQIVNDAARLEQMVITAHGNTKDAPIESPVSLKEKFGWLKTKLTEPRRRRTGENGLASPSAFSHTNGCNGFSDDDSSNSSSIRSPAPSHTPKATKGKGDKSKMEHMIARLPLDQQRMWRLFNSLRDHRDEDGRKLSTAFLRLPTREEYPDYYEVIKKPMDMQRIQQRLNGQGYASWTDIVADFSLMLDNACKYNETDSQIYKDAVSLQRVLLEKKMELGAADDAMPRVQVEIRTMFTNIFHAVFSKKDPKGRCRSDSFADLPDILKSKGLPPDDLPFTFDQIKRNIDKSRYRRLDRFQRDFFDLFEKARLYSPPDSKLFEDAEELQLVFLRERDHHCKSVLVSDAYSIVEGKVREECEILRKQKLKNSEHSNEERRDSMDVIEKEDGEIDIPTLAVKDAIYTVPCYVYVARGDDNSKGRPHIMRIERIFRNESGHNMVHGFWVYRPNETLHLPKRRFLEKEVFLTPFQDNVLAERLQGICQVVSLKTYVNNEIFGFEAKDLYVCESKYLGKPKYFVKIKAWDYPEEEEKLKKLPREKPLEPISFPSSVIKSEMEVMEDGQSSQTSSSSEEDDRLRDSIILDIERPEVKSGQEADADGRTYFNQMLTKCGKHYACGDFVLVFNPQRPYCDVMRVDRLWRQADGSEWFSGGWFARPSDVTHDQGRMFYVREVFAVHQPDQTRRVDDIQNHCAVLTAKEYIKQRPTEVPECDVFVCENRIAGRPLQKGEQSSIFPLPSHKCPEEEPPEGEALHIDSCVQLKRMRQYKNGSLVSDPELFLFKQPIAMEKEMSPLLKNDVAVPLDPLDMDMLDEDTDGAESVTSSKPEMNNWLANQPKLTAKSKSGYILFSAEIRKRIMHENPEAGFGEVSKIVGIEWKKLSEEQKRQYEVRAEFIATERQKQEVARAALKDQLQPGQIRVYHCKWANCDSQFDQENGLYEHIVQHHTSQIIMDSDNQYVCMWITCLRNRKDGKPFPSLPRLHRHMKEKHVNSSVRNMLQSQVGKNFYKLVTNQGPSGDNYHLVHMPFARGLNGAGGPPPTPNHQTPHLNGHPPAPIAINGDHHGSPAVHHPQQPHQPVQYAHQQPSSSHHPPQPHPSSSQMVPQSEAGRLVVKMPAGAEPVFVHMPSSFMSRRVLHSESYLRYIESLSNNRQRTVSHWERCLNANYRNMPPHQQSKKNLPVHWIKQDALGRNVVPEDDVVKALWRLRDQMLESGLGMSTERDYHGVL